MAKVSNESRLIVKLLTEKAKIQKDFCTQNAEKLGNEEMVKNHHYRKGIEWAETVLAGIVYELEHPE